MRKWLVLFVLVGALLVLGVSAQQREQWEYLTIAPLNEVNPPLQAWSGAIVNGQNVQFDGLKHPYEIFNEYGREGWVLVTVSEGLYLFRR